MASSKQQNNSNTAGLTAEERRLLESDRRLKHWKRWGPYLSERQWGTVREDYSTGGTAWDDFSFAQSHSRAYRWGEDGIGGICDRHGFVCFALALWNGRDPILKERIFGLAGQQGNHGEDVKDYYFYLDSTPTHSYMRFLYKYPHSEFPYQWVVEENARRSRNDTEFELIDTGIFDDNRYFDVFVEYAKASPEDILIEIRAINRGPETADLKILPTAWFRNTWSWGADHRRPSITREQSKDDYSALRLDHFYYGSRWLYCEHPDDVLFTENESNKKRLWGLHQDGHAKDAFHEFVIHGNHSAVNPDGRGTKAAAYYSFSIGPGQSKTIRLRLAESQQKTPFDSAFSECLEKRKKEADEFYARVIPSSLSDDAKNVMRQAFAGLLWNKQFYHYEVTRWLEGDPAGPTPPASRLHGRNHGWTHLYNADIISMPDKWEFPWYAAWDLAFHCIPLALIDADFAKSQLILLLREWYMHPSGQLPAYEWSFDDVNPPVHAWAAWRVYKIDEKRTGKADRNFLERVFHKLLLNFSWWVNRKDAAGRNVFEGGFLGLDNIGVFDRSAPLPTGGHIEQSDATSWMAMYCENMMKIALELSRTNSAYEDVASKFFEHFVFITEAMYNIAGEKITVWDEMDGFYYDVLLTPRGRRVRMKIRSMVGLVPLFAAEMLDADIIDKLPGFKKRMQWFIENRPHLALHLETKQDGSKTNRLLSIVNGERLKRILRFMLDENEFLSEHGIRSLSKFHDRVPYVAHVGGTDYVIEYEPAESRTGLFGGNSNWRGPIWFPMNYLLIESLQKFHHFFGDEYQVEYPTGSGKMLNLHDVAADLSRRLNHIFLQEPGGRRPVYGATRKFQEDPHWKDLLLFYEYYHGENGAGIGASHQTGWTGLVAKLLQQSGV